MKNSGEQETRSGALRGKHKNFMKKKLPRQQKRTQKNTGIMSGLKTKFKTGIPDLVKEVKENNTILTTTNTEKANVLGKFFSSVFTKEPDENDSENQHYGNNPILSG